PSVTADVADVDAYALRAVSTWLFASATADSGRTIVAYHWDFDGDGTVDLVHPTGTAWDDQPFAYPEARTYLAKVTVVDDAGLPGFATVAIKVHLVLLDANPNIINAGQSITFTATTSPYPGASVLGYTWDFGDG